MTTVQTRRASAGQTAHRAKSDSDHLGALALSDGLSRDEEPVSRQANHAAIEARAGAAWSKATAGGGGEVPYRREMERAFGQDFSGVKAHVGRKAEMSAIQAKAATVGESVAFAESRPDKRLVAHELTHVVQNRRAKGGGGLRKKTSVSKPGDAAEVEADRMADHVVNRKVKSAVVPGKRGHKVRFNTIVEKSTLTSKERDLGHNGGVAPHQQTYIYSNSAKTMTFVLKNEQGDHKLRELKVKRDKKLPLWFNNTKSAVRVRLFAKSKRLVDVQARGYFTL